jgi:hypothetical protein
MHKCKCKCKNKHKNKKKIVYNKNNIPVDNLFLNSVKTAEYAGRTIPYYADDPTSSVFQQYFLNNYFNTSE